MAQLKTLRESGLPEAQAEAIVSVVESREGDLVTKTYLDAKLAEMENKITGKLVTLGLSTVGLVLAGVYFLLNYTK